MGKKMPRELTKEEWKVRIGTASIPDHARAATSAVDAFGWEDETTQKSVFHFQRAWGRGLPETGVWDERTAQAASFAGKLAVPRAFSFAAEVDIAAVQARLNALGYRPALAVDGISGPKTLAAIKWFQSANGLPSTGVLSPATIAALKLPAAAPSAPSGSPYKPNPNASVSVPTVIAALRQAASEKGYHLSDPLAALMIGQLRGAEGAYPGVGGTLGGTNNIGAAQMTPSLASLKKGLEGWGALAHYDSDPNKGPFMGFYWIAPSALEAARYWLFGNWWGPKLLQGNPQTPEDYATILYKGFYFGGLHRGDPKHEPTSSAGMANIADYASAIRRGIASPAELSGAPGDPSVLSVNPAAFKSLTQRRITEDLFTAAQHGAWASFLPTTWQDFAATNGVLWFGPVPFLEAGAAAMASLQRAIPFWAKLGMFLVTISGLGVLVHALVRRPS
jgi:peptidoglycan hydrolase-like protein with peptidoglycan-binding domain